MQAKQIDIAVAEDNVDFRTALTALLGALGHRVVCEAGDGDELLRACFQNHVDLVIVDLDMPIVDGLEAAEELAKRGIPVILLSGHDDARRVKVEHEPIAVRLLKPATIETLSAAITRAVQ